MHKTVKRLHKASLTKRRANDILRAAGLTAAPLDDPGVMKDLIKVIEGKALSPVLVVSDEKGADIADGYHRASLVYRSIRTAKSRSDAGPPAAAAGDASLRLAGAYQRQRARGRRPARPLHDEHALPRVLPPWLLFGRQCSQVSVGVGCRCGSRVDEDCRVSGHRATTRRLILRWLPSSQTLVGVLR